MNLSRRQLKMLVTTAALGNISRASEALSLSQPALTRALQEMESQLGFSLFARSTRRLTLTSEGERFLPVAERLLRDLDEAVEMIREESTGHRGTVRLAVGEAFGCTVLPGVLAGFTKRLPNVRVQLVADNSSGITRRAIHGEVDFGIGSPIGDTEQLDCDKLLTAPLGVLASPHHFNLPESVSMAALEKLPLLRESNDTSIMHLLNSHGSEIVCWMRNGIEVSTLALQFAMARAGMGLAVMSGLGASHELAKDMKFSRLRPAVCRDVFIMRRRDFRPSQAALALIDAIKCGIATARLHPSIQLAKSEQSTS